MGLPDLGGLPQVPTISGLPELPSLSGLPDIPDLPNLPDDFDDLEERLGNLLTFTQCFCINYFFTFPLYKCIINDF